MNEDNINEFLDILNEEGFDLEDLGLDEDDLDDMDIDDFNSILDSLPDPDDEEED